MNRRKNFLILDNFFNTENYVKFPKFLSKFLFKFKIQTLKRLITKMKRLESNYVDFSIITNSEDKFYINSSITVDRLSDYRVGLDHTEFMEIKRNVSNIFYIFLYYILFNNLFRIQ